MTTKMSKLMAARNILFLLFTSVVVVLFHDFLNELVSISSKSELYSHIILIPFVSGYFIYIRRRALFPEVEYSFTFGIVVILLGIILYFIGLDQGGKLNANDQLVLMVFAFVTCWIGGFLFFYGVRCFRGAAFPLLFLFFLTPIPSHVVETFIRLLQLGSAEVTHLFFRITGVPVLREGFTFHLSGMSVEVAKQCSGIRSSIALVITSIIAGQLFLKTGWRKWALVLSIFPITIFKNGLRIATLSLLGNYVDPRILSSELHKSGGIPFFLVALMLLAPVLWFLRRSELLRKDGIIE